MKEGFVSDFLFVELSRRTALSAAPQQNICSVHAPPRKLRVRLSPFASAAAF
jgi:hypothetical protein